MVNKYVTRQVILYGVLILALPVIAQAEAPFPLPTFSEEDYEHHYDPQLGILEWEIPEGWSKNGKRFTVGGKFADNLDAPGTDWEWEMEFHSPGVPLFTLPMIFRADDFGDERFPVWGGVPMGGDRNPAYFHFKLSESGKYPEYETTDVGEEKFEYLMWVNPNIGGKPFRHDCTFCERKGPLIGLRQQNGLPPEWIPMPYEVVMGMPHVEVIVRRIPPPPPIDVTVPGDTILGVPNDGVTTGGGDNGWPGNEHPALAIDDNVITKYLHFKGEVEPTGLRITPLVGSSIVTELALTTANDATPRDPASFELSGSNIGIDGPYELIASGDIVDFIQAEAWPRFTKNATPITFDNSTAYAHYQLMFPTIRDAGSANSMQIAEVELLGVIAPAGAELLAAFAFGSRYLVYPTFNNRAFYYTMVVHESPEAVQYDAARGYGYEVLHPADSPYGDRGGYGIFGPFDDSPNNRNKFPDDGPEQIYDSFIGAKNFLNECNAETMGDMDTPCDVPEGIIFRVDVPNGLYRFVGAFGDVDNVHAHRILAEDGGSGPPENIGPNYVVLVSNFDQAQQTIGEADEAELGEGVLARVGFDGKIPPPGDGIFPSPQFVDMDENGMPTVDPSSPVLEVTQGYIRIHQLQGNSNDGPGGPRDANGGDIVILELWTVD